MVLNLFYATQTLSVQENLKPNLPEYSSEIIKIIKIIINQNDKIIII